MARVGIIIQARMSSSRLAGKVLMEHSGHAMLWHVVERCRESKKADIVIVATSIENSDDIIEAFCKEHDYVCYRGSLDDVLERFYKCANQHKLDYIVRVMGASPLLDASIIDGVIDGLLASEGEGVRYVSNALERIYPRGLDAEAFSFKALEEAQQHAITEEEREHVTPYMRKHFKTKPYIVEEDLRADFRLTIDEIDDFRLVNHIYEKFYKKGNLIDMKKVIVYLKENPKIASMNSHVEQKEVSY